VIIFLQHLVGYTERHKKWYMKLNLSSVGGSTTLRCYFRIRASCLLSEHCSSANNEAKLQSSPACRRWRSTLNYCQFISPKQQTPSTEFFCRYFWWRSGPICRHNVALFVWPKSNQLN